MRLFFLNLLLISAYSVTSVFSSSENTKTPSTSNSFSGAYGGFGIGYSQLNIKSTEGVDQNSDYGSESNFTDNKNSSSKKPLVSFHMEYDHQFQNDAVLGAELSLNLPFHSCVNKAKLIKDTYHGNNNKHENSSTIKNTFNVSFLLKAGKAFSNHMVYATAGAVLGRYEITNELNTMRIEYLE